MNTFMAWETWRPVNTAVLITSQFWKSNKQHCCYTVSLRWKRSSITWILIIIIILSCVSVTKDGVRIAN
jgi:hypothetical protein